MKNLRLEWGWIVWICVAVSGCAVVFFRIGHNSIWSDEAVSIAMTNVGFSDILRIGRSDVHPPLYYSSLKLFSMVFGHSRAALRCFSALGLLSTALLIGIGPVSRIFNRCTGRIYAFLILFAPLFISQAQEIRMYTWATFFITACITQGYLYCRDGQRRDLVLFWLSSLGGMYIHYFVTLGVFFVHLFLLVWIVRSRRRLLKSFLAESLLIILFFSPWILTLFSQVSRTVGNYWIQPPNVKTVLDTLLVPFTAKTGYLFIAPYVMLACFLFFAYGIYAARKRGDDWEFLVLALNVYLSSLVFVLVFSLTLRPILVPRYMLAYWGILFIGVACGIEAVFRWRGNIGKSITALVLTVYALSAIPYLNLQYNYQLNGPMDDTRQFAVDNFRKDQTIIYFDDDTLQSFIVEFPGLNHIAYGSSSNGFLDSFGLFGDKFKVITDLADLDTGEKSIWLAASPEGSGYEVFRNLVRSMGINPDNPVIWDKDWRERYTTYPVPGRMIRFSEPLSDFTIDMVMLTRR